MTADEHQLGRFVTAQEGVIDTACRELRAGRKRTHWMWYVFPQVEGLGSSETARYYAIRSLDEAAAYVAHPVLGPRLKEAAAAALASGVRDATALFGRPDDLKFRSSMTLFALAAPRESVFSEALQRFFDGSPDPETCRILGRRFDEFT